MKLSNDLKNWRAERPDEWVMDRFIKKAIKLEQKFEDIKKQARKVRNYSNSNDIFKAIPLTVLNDERAKE